nr:immunoglobulin heavy chain junction region [Mus musculus]
CASVYGLNYW